MVWSKGHAARLILNEAYGNGWEKNVRVIYMGDDTSDEDVMEVCCEYEYVTGGSGFFYGPILMNDQFCVVVFFFVDAKRQSNHISYHRKTRFKNTRHL